jgi:hypothetical protein
VSQSSDCVASAGVPYFWAAAVELEVAFTVLFEDTVTLASVPVEFDSARVVLIAVVFEVALVCT